MLRCRGELTGDNMNDKKPLGRKSYGHIPHLPNSRMGVADHKCSEGQARIATEKKRDKHDNIIVQEKLDGSNVGVAKINGDIIALTRSGYTAISSPYEQHHYYDKWVNKNKSRFDKILNEGERICGEWLLQAHGTRYNLKDKEPFVAFDLYDNNNKRILFLELIKRVNVEFQIPLTLSIADPISIETAIRRLENNNDFNAIDKREGVVYRVERNRVINKQTGERKKEVDFLVKYVRPDKKDGIYLPSVSNKPPVYNCDLEKYT